MENIIIYNFLKNYNCQNYYSVIHTWNIINFFYISPCTGDVVGLGRTTGHSQIYSSPLQSIWKKEKRKKKGEKGPKLSKELWLVVIKKEEEGLGYISGVQCR